VRRPRLVLRVGFAGNRELPADRMPDLRTALAAVYDVISSRLEEIAPGIDVPGEAPPIARFYLNEAPLLRLVTGLAEGGDALAAQVLSERSGHGSVQSENAAVLPFDLETYRRSRDQAFRATFDELVASCKWILELDGIYEKPAPDTPTAKDRRARAYRAQSKMLLRQCDLLVVLADRSAERSAGGSMETVGRALALGMPVLLIDRSSARLLCFEPGDDADARSTAKGGHAASDPEWKRCVRRWVDVIVADPDTQPTTGAFGETPTGPTGQELLEEVFDPGPDCPPRGPDGSRRVPWRERVWTEFQKRFRPRDPLPGAPDRPLEPFGDLRSRARELNYHYAGLYRGTLLSNYLFAVLAVTIAALSLLLMGHQRTGPVDQLARNLETAAPAAGQIGAGSWLLVLSLVKLGLVSAIFLNTRRGNQRHWNDRAIDCRYLAERLRASFYLPLVGSFRPPGASQPQFASRALRQSAIDWAFDAIMRSASPSEIDALAVDPPPGPAPEKLLRANPGAALNAILDSWIKGQIAYHENNAITMHRMTEWIETWIRRFSAVVILVVAVDVLILGSILFGASSGVALLLRPIAPFLVLSSAVLPAAVAGLNGLRFQAECRRLADRSIVMARLLQRSAERGRALADEIASEAANPDTAAGSWTPEVLDHVERIARHMVEEVSEWSVVYAKELQGG